MNSYNTLYLNVTDRPLEVAVRRNESALASYHSSTDVLKVGRSTNGNAALGYF
jgi:hypothetical protein